MNKWKPPKGLSFIRCVCGPRVQGLMQRGPMMVFLSFEQVFLYSKTDYDKGHSIFAFL